jgi:hypothetical protein
MNNGGVDFSGLGTADEDRLIGPNEFPWDDIQVPDDMTPLAEQGDEGEDDRQEDQDVVERFPVQVISGVAGEFAKLYSAYMESPIEFFYMAFLTCFGSVLAGRLTLASEISQQPRLYVMLLGESADVRKSTAIKKTVEFFDVFFEEFFDVFAVALLPPRLNVSWGVGSAEGLQKSLNESSPLLLAIDEFKAFVGKCKVQASVLLPCVNTLFESNEYENSTAKSSIELRGVHLSILAACTVETYNRTWDSSFTDIGFTNRLFIVPASGEKRFSIPRKIPEEKKRLIKLWLKGLFHFVGEGLELDMTEGARNRYDNWYTNLERSVHTKRLDTYASRFMLLLAVNESKTEIDEEIVEKAIALADWQLAMRRQYDPIDAETKVAAMEEKIRRRLNVKPHSDRELRQHCNANRYGIRIYQWALDNLKSVREVSIDSEAKVWRYCDSRD